MGCLCACRVRGCAGVVGLQIHAAGNDLQYLVPAPAIERGDDGQAGVPADGEQAAAPGKPNAPTLALWNSLQTTAESWNGMLERYTLSGIAQSVSLSADTEETTQARLNALGPDAFALAPQYLFVGRLFYPEELEKGADGILLDEQLALALFRVAEPVGRTVTVSGVEFTVIGVLRHSKRVGDSTDYAAYVTLAHLWDETIQLDALQVTARPVSGAGARASFLTDMETWQAGGTLIDLRKEAIGALLPLRVLLFVCGAAVFFRLLGVWVRRLQWFVADIKERLRLEYAQKLAPRLLAGALLFTLAGGLLALGAGVLIRYIVAPVYTFPEWVPAVLVDWGDIQTTFWQVWQDQAGLMELRSPELIRIRYFGMLTAWFSAAAAVVLASLWARFLRGQTRHSSS